MANEAVREGIDFGRMRRIVVKVGTSVLRRRAGAAGADARVIRSLARQIVAIAGDLQVILVSSGAVGFGMLKLGMKSRPTETAMLQAAAAVGQPDMMREWSEAFARAGRVAGQVLLTNDGLSERKRFLNAKATLQKLLDLGAVPIVNENDTVAVEELTFGDNDKLAALVAVMTDSDLMINLTSVNGYRTRPDDARSVVSCVRRVGKSWSQVDVHKKDSALAIGGMAAKLRAAEITMRSGVPLVIAHGRAKNILARILSGSKVGTLFLPEGGALTGRKRWLSFFPAVLGTVTIDAGAVKALRERGKSLLPSGIRAVAGFFPAKSLIAALDEQGAEVARGITAYSSRELGIIAGHDSRQIRKLLGYPDSRPAPEEVIHREDMVIRVGQGAEGRGH